MAGRATIGCLIGIVGIVGGAIVKSKTKVGGWLMIISAVGGFITVGLFYLLGGLLLLIGGGMALLKKDEEAKKK